MSAGPKDEFSIELVSGAYLDLWRPVPSDIDLDVIATSLARTNRYVGQSRVAYSVAEHAVLVSSKLAAQGGDTHTQLLGLHHDSAEAFTGDLSRPYKRLIAMLAGAGVIKSIEDELDRAILDALAIEPPGYTQRRFVKAADDWACACEAWYLLPSKGAGWAPASYRPDEKYHPQMVPCGLPEQIAKLYFVERHLRLVSEMAEGVR